MMKLKTTTEEYENGRVQMTVQVVRGRDPEIIPLPSYPEDGTLQVFLNGVLQPPRSYYTKNRDLYPEAIKLKPGCEIILLYTATSTAE